MYEVRFGDPNQAQPRNESVTVWFEQPRHRGLNAKTLNR